MMGIFNKIPIVSFLGFCLFGCTYPIYYNVTDCPEAKELVSHRYVTKGDLFLVKAEVVGPYIGKIHSKYTLEPPGYFRSTPKDVDLYWKYENSWYEHDGGPKRLSKPDTIVAVIPKGTIVRVTHVEQMSSSSIQERFTSYFGCINDFRFKGEFIEICGLVSVFELPFDGYTVLVDEHYLEAVDNG